MKMPPDTVAELASMSLRVHALHHEMMASYVILLEKEVFNCFAADRKVDKKEEQKFRRALRSHDAYKILSIVWKESEFITSEDLRAAGLSSLFEDKQLTAHRLACEIAETTHGVAAINSRIRNIAIAAAAYQLVDRSAVRPTAVILKGTELLHNLMMKLSERNIQAWTGFTEISHPNSPGDG